MPRKGGALPAQRRHGNSKVLLPLGLFEESEDYPIGRG
jgi:hypothetical protein